MSFSSSPPGPSSLSFPSFSADGTFAFNAVNRTPDVCPSACPVLLPVFSCSALSDSSPYVVSCFSGVCEGCVLWDVAVLWVTLRAAGRESCVSAAAGVRDPLRGMRDGLCAPAEEGLCDTSKPSVFDVDLLWEPVLELDRETAEFKVPDVSRV